MHNGVVKSPVFVEIFLYLPAVSNQIVDRIINSKADDNTCNQACHQGKLYSQPSHNAEVNDNGKTIGHNRNQAYLARYKKQEHDNKNDHKSNGKAFDLTFCDHITALRYEDADTGNMEIEISCIILLQMLSNCFLYIE